MKLDREAAVPLHKQIADLLRERIERGEFRPGDRLPTEEELCRLLGVSRTPVRQALNQLVQEGWIERRRKLGTRVRGGSSHTLVVLIPEERWELPLKLGLELYRRAFPARSLRLSTHTVGQEGLREKIIQAVARGNAPDIALIDMVWLSEFVTLDFLCPIGELDPTWIHQVDFFPSVLAGNTIQGELYGLQPEADLSGLWFRRDWLEKEGIPPPTTWEELLNIARHFAKKPPRSRPRAWYPLLFPGGRRAGETTTYVLLSLIHSAGGEVFRDGQVELGEPAEMALQFLSELIHRYRLAPKEVVDFSWDQAPISFGHGECAFALGGSYEKALIKRAAGWDDAAFGERVGFLPVPAAPGGRQATIAGGMTYVIFRQSKSTQTAFKLLQLALSPRAMRDFCVSTGQNPTRLSAVELLDPNKDGFLQETARLLSQARFRPQLPTYARISRELQGMLEAVLVGEVRPREAVRRTEAVLCALTP